MQGNGLGVDVTTITINAMSSTLPSLYTELHLHSTYEHIKILLIWSGN